MDLGIRGETAIVTGAASNIGRAIALRLAREGANVVIADVDDEQSTKTVREIVRQGGLATAIATDVINDDSVARMVDQAVAQFTTLHILVNSVGWGDIPPFMETDTALWDKLPALNYSSMMQCSRAIAPLMVAQGYGRIVNIVSDTGRAGRNHEAAYSGSIAAVIASTKSVAREVGRFGVTVNAIWPGFALPDGRDSVGDHSLCSAHGGMQELFTPQARGKVACRVPPGRVAMPEDVAKLVAFLASSAASFISGQTIGVSARG